MCSKSKIYYLIRLYLITLCLPSVVPDISVDLSRYITLNWKNYTISVHGNFTAVVSNIQEAEVQKFQTSYYCVMKDSGDYIQHRILSGSGSWTFPRQDTNLTLVYPTNAGLSSKTRGFVITSWSVELAQDTASSSGRVVGGGVLRDRVALTFLSAGATQLAYRFEVFGIEAQNLKTEMADSIVCS